ncbi:MAG: hypothetical protein CVT64_04015 [Actinobacteria bacterium HGW-Actinobacteria-4]|nr:MAG: hypothetical protein CVT64_04015 [Actinobacteria bacterium HGW-Actinobacteria-4]
MEVSVLEAAAIMNVSPRRVRELVREQRIPGRRVGGAWLVDAGGVRPTRGRLPRPMSARNAWALAQLVEGASLEHLSPSERWRLREMRNALVHRDNPEQVLEAWLRKRADRVLRAASDLARLRDDPRLVPTGVSDPRSQMAAAQLLEAYVHTADVNDLQLDHLLVPANVADANLVLHVVDEPAHMPSGPAPRLALAADLAEWGSWRESNRAREIIEAAAGSGS